jgi:hypothetical protein
VTGRLSVLNVGAGDIEVRFNKHQPDEVVRAIKMLKDMQKRGYAILVKQDDGSYVRAIEIDAEHQCYVISDGPPPVEAVVDEAAVTVKPGNGRRRRGYRRRQPIATSEAVGVARSAGG